MARHPMADAILKSALAAPPPDDVPPPSDPGGDPLGDAVTELAAALAAKPVDVEAGKAALRLAFQFIESEEDSDDAEPPAPSDQ
jgi:hypothetical protein